MWQTSKRWLTHTEETSPNCSSGNVILLNTVYCSFWKDAELSGKQFSRNWSIYVYDATGQCRPGSNIIWIHGSYLQTCGWISWTAPSRCLYLHRTTQTQTSMSPEAFERRNSTVRMVETTAIANDTAGSCVAYIHAFLRQLLFLQFIFSASRNIFVC